MNGSSLWIVSERGTASQKKAVGGGAERKVGTPSGTLDTLCCVTHNQKDTDGTEDMNVSKLSVLQMPGGQDFKGSVYITFDKFIGHHLSCKIGEFWVNTTTENDEKSQQVVGGS